MVHLVACGVATQWQFRVGGVWGAQPADLRSRAQDMAAHLWQADVNVCVVNSTAMVGGGGAPEVVLPSVALSLPERYGAALRLGTPPIVGRVMDGRCLLDLRTIDPVRDTQVVQAVRSTS